MALVPWGFFYLAVASDFVNTGSHEHDGAYWGVDRGAGPRGRWYVDACEEPAILDRKGRKKEKNGMLPSWKNVSQG